jgi:hypothetical protein
MSYVKNSRVMTIPQNEVVLNESGDPEGPHLRIKGNAITPNRVTITIGELSCMGDASRLIAAINAVTFRKRE